MELENAAVDTVEVETDQEVAEPDESPEEGSNYEEVANPQSEEEVTEQSHEDNARFQEYRHRLEDAERERDEIRKELDELKAAQTVRDEVYSEYLDDEDVDSVVADALGISTEELNARIEERAEIERLKAENEQFKAAILATLERADRAMTIKELQTECAAIAGLTNQRITHMLTDLRKDGKIMREYVKKVPYFAIGAEETDE
jgi:hypothetical protein